MDKSFEIGSWAADRDSIEKAVRSEQGDFSDLTVIQRFPVYIARAIYKFEQNNSDGAKRPAAFVLVDDPLVFREIKKGRAKDVMYATGGKPLGGRIHFVPSGMARCVYEEFDGGDDGPIFERLENLELDDLPTLVYVPGPKESVLEFFPHGAGEDKDRRSITLRQGKSILPRDIVSAINAVYDAELKTPDLTTIFPIWEQASKGWPIREAERGIQAFVRIGLATRFPWCRVAMEQPDKEGRTDLELLDETSASAGEVIRHAILELKVLRSKGSGGNLYTAAQMNEHISDGVEQAYTYGARRNTIHRLLCCFDMRDNDAGDEETFAHVATRAATLAVKLHRWFLYRSSDQYRKACVASVLTIESHPAA